MEQIEEKTTTIQKNNFSELNKWNVIFYDDNKTTMEFVIGVLMEIFKHSNDSATELTMQIHHEGKAVAGRYTYEIAQQKASDTLNVAAIYDFPLMVTIEKSE